jgi:hypothetical protein
MSTKVSLSLGGSIADVEGFLCGGGAVVSLSVEPGLVNSQWQGYNRSKAKGWSLGAGLL